jgi:hypothetical protein
MTASFKIISKSPFTHHSLIRLYTILVRRKISLCIFPLRQQVIVKCAWTFICAVVCWVKCVSVNIGRARARAFSGRRYHFRGVYFLFVRFYKEEARALLTNAFWSLVPQKRYIHGTPQPAGPINPSKPSGNYMYHLLYRSATLFVSRCKQQLFP